MPKPTNLKYIPLHIMFFNSQCLALSHSIKLKIISNGSSLNVVMRSLVGRVHSTITREQYAQLSFIHTRANELPFTTSIVHIDFVTLAINCRTIGMPPLGLVETVPDWDLQVLPVRREKCPTFYLFGDPIFIEEQKEGPLTYYLEVLLQGSAVWPRAHWLD